MAWYLPDASAILFAMGASRPPCTSFLVDNSFHKTQLMNWIAAQKEQNITAWADYERENGPIMGLFSRNVDDARDQQRVVDQARATNTTTVFWTDKETGQDRSQDISGSSSDVDRFIQSIKAAGHTYTGSAS